MRRGRPPTSLWGEGPAEAFHAVGIDCGLEGTYTGSPQGPMPA